MSVENTCGIFPDHPEYCAWLLGCKWISASISIIGCLFTIFIIWLFHKYTEFTQRMILHLSVGTLIQAISYVIEDTVSETSLLCIIQGALMQFSAWVILLWILALILNLLMQVFFERKLDKYEIQVTLFCWVLPIILAALPFADKAYAPAGAWCWLKNTWGWRFGSWYIWSMLSEVVILVSIALITYKLRKDEKSVVGAFDTGYKARHKVIKECARTLRVYPIAYFLVILFPTVNRIQNLIHGSQGQDAYIFPLLLLHCLTDPLEGAVITIAFLMDRQTRRKLKFKRIKEAWKRRFQKKVEICEFKVKSKLSGSDFVVAARLSVTTFDENKENEFQSATDLKRKDKNEGKMETVSESGVKINNKENIKRKQESRRRVSICLVKDIEAFIKEQKDRLDGKDFERNNTATI